MNRLIKFFCLAVLLMLAYLVTQAQSTGAAAAVVIKGKVIDKKSKEGMQGVSVSEMDADGRIIKGAGTDIEGNYVLKVTNPKNKISVSFVGYRTMTFDINGRTTINFQLETAGAEMEQVVVTTSRGVNNGLNSTPERKITTAVATIAAKSC